MFHCYLLIKIIRKNKKIRFNSLDLGKKYYLVETEAPDGYRLPENNDPVEIYAQIEMVGGQDVFAFYVNGTRYDESNVLGDIHLEGTIVDRMICLNIINTTVQVLPETGSMLLVPMMLLGTMFIRVAFMIDAKDNKLTKK